MQLNKWFWPEQRGQFTAVSFISSCHPQKEETNRVTFLEIGPPHQPKLAWSKGLSSKETESAISLGKDTTTWNIRFFSPSEQAGHTHIHYYLAANEKVLFWMPIPTDYVALNYGICNCWLRHDQGACCLKDHNLALSNQYTIWKPSRCTVWFRNAESAARSLPHKSC